MGVKGMETWSCLFPVWLEELAFASPFTAALPNEGIVLGAVGGEKES